MDFQENLFDAVVNGDEEAVLAMLRQGAQINNGDADGLTALHWASGNPTTKLYLFLLYRNFLSEFFLSG